MLVAEPKEAVEPSVATAIQKAKAKNARLRLMKERNEHYLAEQRGEDAADEELTKGLRVSTGA
jgi:hypothetical protein